MKEGNLLQNLVGFNSKSTPKTIEGKKKEILVKVHMLFMKVED